MDKWGEYKGNVNGVPLEISGVIETIQRNDSTITCVYGKLSSEEVDWEVAGRAIGNSLELKHLSLRFDVSESVDNIRSFFKGLALNRSIESLYLFYIGTGDESCDISKGVYEYLVPFFMENRYLASVVIQLDQGVFFPESIMNTIQRSPFIKSVKIGSAGYRGCNTKDVEHLLEALCRKQPGLKHITIASLPISSNGSDELRNLLCDEHCVLESLVLTDVRISGNTSIALIGNGLAENVSVKCFRLEMSESSTTDWSILFDSMHTTALREIHLSGIVRSDSTMVALANSLASSQAVRVLRLEYCSSITSYGWDSFASMLASHTTIENIVVTDTDISAKDNLTESLSRALCVNSRLREARLPVTNVEQLRIVAIALENPNSALQHLFIEYSDEFDRTEGFVEEIDPNLDVGFTQMFVDSLQRNTTLKGLGFEYCSLRGYFEFDWPMFSNLLCNRTSIDATYNSNHTLQSVTGYWDFPIPISELLDLNRNTNKHAVARQKIVQNHLVENVNFAPRSLPIALSWAVKADISGLSVIYGILRKVPDVIQKETKKRSAQEMG